MRGGRRSTSFQPGVSGNPGGRPRRPTAVEARRIEADAKALARECAPEAVSTLKTIMLNEKAPPAARISAATALLDRGYGRPPQAVDLKAQPYDLDKLNDAQLEQLEQILMIMEEPGSVDRTLPLAIEGR